MDGLSGRPGNGPGAPAAFAGNFTAGLLWKVTSNGLWLNGYYHWVPTGGDTVAKKFALWQLANPATNQVLVPAGTVTSGVMTANAWNFVPLPTPIGLSGNVAYCVAIGWVSVNGFPDTQNQFGAGNTYSAGITNGPLQCYSDQGGSNTEPFTTNYNQGLFGTSTADPSVTMPTTGDVHSNFWVDIQVTDQAPAGAAYSLWPSQPYPVSYANDTAPTPLNFTLATEFILSQACTLNQISFYSPSGAAGLPSRCAIWNVGSQSIVAGTDNASPSWSGAAGSGKVTVNYAGVTLQAGIKYKVAVFGNQATYWNAATTTYWSGGGPGTGGITNGPLSAPDNAGATSPGQGTYDQGASMAYPLSTSVSSNYWVDLLVTPQAAAGGQPIPADQMTASGGSVYAAVWDKWPIRRLGT